MGLAGRKMAALPATAYACDGRIFKLSIEMTSGR